jgi:peroxisomal membrane protein 4
MPPSSASAAPAAGLRALLVALRALRHGGSYGVRVRLPHALVSGVLYSRDRGLLDVAKRALENSFEHGRNLALFAACYKLLLLLMRVTAEGPSAVRAAAVSDPPSLGRPALGWHAAVAGAVGAALVWRKPTPVNLQISLYLLSRVLFGLCRVLAARGVAPFSLVKYDDVVRGPLQVGVWALVMWLWEVHRGLLQRSLAVSMDDIYRAADSGGVGAVAVAGLASGGAGATAAAPAAAAAAAAPWWAGLAPTPAAALTLLFGIVSGMPLLP